jgi:pantoate--beta-alanine ligase
LSVSERKIAPALHASLKSAAAAICNGQAPDNAAKRARSRLKSAGFKVDYVAARNADTLARIEATSEPVRLLAAAWLGKTRLIDNIAV